MSQAKRNSLLLLLLFGMLTLIVAMSLPNLVLAPGQPFSLGQPQLASPGTSGALPGGELLVLLMRGILALTIIVFPLYVLYSLQTPEGRRRLIVNIVLIVMLFVAADYLRTRNTGHEEPLQAAAPQAVEKTLAASSPAAIFSATPPPGLTLIVALGTSIAIALLIVAAIWFLRRRILSEPPLERLAREVQSAIESLQMGNDWKVTVIRCYQQMSRVVQEEQGIARESTMTPREFEEQLISKGLPQEPIKTLTALFERVRYGNTPADDREEALALSCLTAIVDACGVGGKSREN